MKKPRAKRPPLPNKYVKVCDFNPDSYLEVQSLAAHFNVRLPHRKDSDDENALSTEKKFLLKAARKYPVFAKVLACKERWKMISTYKWKLDANNRIHYTIGHHPSTWRKSCRNINAQNIPKRSALADEFRRMVIAPPGHVIMACDSSAIEAVLVGYFAQSPRYIALAKAGVHDWFNSVVHNEAIDLHLDDAALRTACQEAKHRYDKPSRETAKRVVHLSNYRGTPERMFEEYPDDFESVAHARRLQNVYLASEPGQDIVRWWRQVLTMAGPPNRSLLNPFGFRHRFFHVFNYNRRTQGWEPNGDDAKRAIAFLPQSTASAIQDVYIEALWQTPLASWCVLPVHDDLLSYVPQSEAAAAAATLQRIFTMPIPELGGLSVGAEISMSAVGGNWAPRSDSNPTGMEVWNG